MSLNTGRFNSVNPHLPSGVDIVHDKENDVKLAHFNWFSSKASGSLGASRPSARVVKMALGRQGDVECVSMPDELCMQSLLSFLGRLVICISGKDINVVITDDHKILVELACSTALAAAFKPALFDSLVPSKDSSGKRTVVFIVCGGFKISLDDVTTYREVVNKDVRDNGVDWEILCSNGRKVKVNKL
jgi:L-serine/L-threonine ammonia-lyase